ncbi:MAG: serine/threonine protein kinase, partial [Pirellulaceae bacterium]
YLAQKRPISHRQSAHWIAELADCLQHAHDRGVIHRDLKPANIMIQLETDAGDEEEQGSREPILVPCLLDFGISRCLRDNPSLTLPGEMVGTPSYTSPEQANGRSREASCLSDIYSLGAIFYELLAGHPPFGGEPLELLRQIGEREVPPLAECGQTIDAELAAICHRALRLRPAARYRSAGELADDLRRWLRGVPAPKQRPGCQGWPRRRPQGKAGTSWGHLGLIACLAFVLGGLGFQLSLRDATSSPAFFHQSTPHAALPPQES